MEAESRYVVVGVKECQNRFTTYDDNITTYVFSSIGFHLGRSVTSSSVW